MHRRVAVLLGSLLLVPALAGCGGGGDRSVSGASGTWAPRTAAASPSPRVLTVEQARVRYQQIVAPYNEAITKFSAAARANAPWRDLLPLAAKVAQAARSHGAQLQATAWPGPVRAPMAELLKENAIAAGYWEQASKATTSDAFAAAVRSADAHGGGKAANEIRAALGLPPVGS